jgi:hypothetical protein
MTFGQEFNRIDLLILLLFGALFTGVIAALLLALRNVQRHSRELISVMRDSYERQIYRMNDELTASAERWRDVNHLLLDSQRAQGAVDISKQTHLSAFLKDNRVEPEDTIPDPRLVFVLTPFNDLFDDVFQTIRAACIDVGLTCYRGDEEFIHGPILPHILKLLSKSSVVIANIEGRNPNVFYELGLAHAMDKTTILVARSVEGLPVDLRADRMVIYHDMGRLRHQLMEELLKLAHRGGTH